MNFKDIYSKRNLWTHKGEHGYVLVVSGSKRYSGSPVFNREPIWFAAWGRKEQ